MRYLATAGQVSDRPMGLEHPELLTHPRSVGHAADGGDPLVVLVHWSGCRDMPTVVTRSRVSMTLSPCDSVRHSGATAAYRGHPALRSRSIGVDVSPAQQLQRPLRRVARALNFVGLGRGCDGFVLPYPSKSRLMRSTNCLSTASTCECHSRKYSLNTADELGRLRIAFHPVG